MGGGVGVLHDAVAALYSAPVGDVVQVTAHLPGGSMNRFGHQNVRAASCGLRVDSNGCFVFEAWRKSVGKRPTQPAPPLTPRHASVLCWSG